MILNILDIEKMLPHRYPFLMVDGVMEIENGVSIKAIKNVTVNEPFFQGHFIENPIMPGVMIIEALAQTVAIMYCNEAYQQCKAEGVMNAEMIKGKVGLLATVENMKFKHMVRPGDRLCLCAKTEESFGNCMKVKVWAETDSKVVAMGRMKVTHS